MLTIAGSDSGGGAGIQADLKVAAAYGVYGASALTAITAQNTRGVTRVEILAPELIAAQIDAVVDDIGADAVKIGMLGGAAQIEIVADRLAHHRRTARGPAHVVLDPVMVAQSGDPLLADDAVAVLASHLLPLATVVTPNLPEAARLCAALGHAVTADELAADDAAGGGEARRLAGGIVG
ncbi:MAG: bifunctional hydroxymethylpyrimidine kinase/phosphomethylpyrimidine kinase, partial [Acidobacteriota bacterium]